MLFLLFFSSSCCYSWLAAAYSNGASTPGCGWCFKVLREGGSRSAHWRVSKTEAAVGSCCWNGLCRSGKREERLKFTFQTSKSHFKHAWLEYNQPIKDICLFCLLDFKHKHLIFLTRRDQNSISGEIWIAPCISYLPQRKIYFSKLLIVKIAKCVLCLFCIWERWKLKK